MDANPGKYTVLDYGMRWGIENMFSDFKSRGFGLMQSHIQKPDRLERLILIMAALSWRSPGNVRRASGRRRRRKKGTLKQALRSLTSLFKSGLRFIRRCLAMAQPIPNLWQVWDAKGTLPSEN